MNKFYLQVSKSQKFLSVKSEFCNKDFCRCLRGKFLHEKRINETPCHCYFYRFDALSKLHKNLRNLNLLT